MSIDTAAPAIPAAQADPVGGAMPGWHIYADLTPPELVSLRAVRRVRVWVAIGLVVVIAALGAGYQFLRMQAADATAAVEAEQAIGDSLRAQQAQFTGLTSTQGAIKQARQQLATLLATDVDVDALLGDVWSALPPDMTIDQVVVTIPAEPQAQPETDGAETAAQIGTVTLEGSGAVIDDLAAFVGNLSAIDGILDPFPARNEATDTGTSYAVQFALTDTRYSHRFDVTEEN